MANRYDRQADIVKAGELTFPIHVLGAGGIGSWTTLLLAKMGCSNIIVYDDDTVEDHNVASQFFKEDQLGMKKIDALYDSVLEQTGVEIEREYDIKDEEYIDSGLVIIAIDSMAERIRLGKIYENGPINIIDGRMGGLTLEIYSCSSSNYLDTTVPPEDVTTDRCTEKAISFNCAVIAGLITNLVRKHAKGDTSFVDEQHFCFNTLTYLKKNTSVVSQPSSDTITIDEIPQQPHDRPF